MSNSPMLSPVPDRQPILCYVDDAWAFFTTCPLDQQWGDDWNDAPYEHNAGYPYEWAAYRNTPPYTIVKAAWEGPFTLPCWLRQPNSPYSVEMINRREVAWFTPDFALDGTPPIYAGTTLLEFIALMRRAGGEVYLPAP